MSTIEQWAPIDGFDNYLISDYGRVMNSDSELIKIPTPNQQGIPSVNLVRDHVQYRRAIAPLVARAFLPAPSRETFDTPINLDGDRFNNHVENLMWRPRWFAVKYHAQLKDPFPAYGYRGGVVDVETGETFVHLRDCVTKYGLLEKDVLLAALNDKAVFPTGQRFRRIR